MQRSRGLRGRCLTLLCGLPTASETGNDSVPRFFYVFSDRMTTSKNERITENIVRDILDDLGYRDDENITIEEQKSANARIQKLLQSASKSGKGVGKPEFIITSKKESDILIVIECKADTRYHESTNKDQYKDYAVDGVLNYAAYLSKEYNVIAIAVSGQNQTELLVSTFLWVKNDSATYNELLDNKGSKPVKRLVTFDQYVQNAIYDPKIEKGRYDSLIAFSKTLHNDIRDYGKVSEANKPLLVSGILLALMNNAFTKSYKHLDQEKELPNNLTDAIKRQIAITEMPDWKMNVMTQPYSFISVHPELKKINQSISQTPLYKFVSDMDEKVRPFIKDYHNFDVLGSFYGEFLSYTGGDQQGLGIVLTPKHLTELFAKIANLRKDSVVLDTCAGTSGFLISAMTEMLKKAETDQERKHIRRNCLIGIEQQPEMYALAVSNMILRGDGKANIHQGNCFDIAMINAVKGKADVGMINPPYSQKGDGLHELHFIENLLNCLKPNGVAIAVVPMSCAISPHSMREKILQNHRLDAVMSLPDDIFYPVGVVVCIMVFTAHIPHELNQYHQSWFGYWKNDGHVKTKNKGRVDNGKWKEIEETWLQAYHTRSQVAGQSVLKKVNAKDEWCAEAYMETDYSDISENDFINEIKKYVLFKAMNQ